MAVSISVTTVKAASITVKVTLDSNYRYYRIYCRTKDSSWGTFNKRDESFTSKTGSTWSFTFKGLTPDTEYVFNVQYNTSASTTGATWAGATSATKTNAVSTTGSATTSSSKPLQITTSRGSNSEFPYTKVWYRKSSTYQYPTTSNTYESFTSKNIITPSSGTYYVSIDIATGANYSGTAEPDSAVTVYRILNGKSVTVSAPSARGFTPSLRSGYYNTIQVSVNSVSHSLTSYQIRYGTTTSMTSTLGPYSSSSSQTKYITGLAADTTYYIQVDIIVEDTNGGTTIYDGTRQQIKTGVQPTRTFSAAAVAESSSEIKVTIGAVNNSNFPQYRIGYSTTQSSYNYIESSTASSTSSTITGLSENTTYYFVYEIYYNGAWNRISSENVKTNLKVKNNGVTSTSITSYISGFTSNFSYDRVFYFQAYLPGSSTVEGQNEITIPAGSTSTSTGNVTISGLSPGTTYNIKSQIYYTTGTKNYWLYPEGYQITTSASTTTRFSLSKPDTGYQESTYSDRFTVTLSPTDSNYGWRRIRYRKAGTTDSYSITTTTQFTSRTVSGLLSGTKYEVRIDVATSQTSITFLETPDSPQYITTNPQAEQTAIRETSITAQLPRISNVNYARTVTIDAYQNGTKYQSCSVPINVPSGETSASGIKIDGLKPGETYDIHCYVELKNTSPSTYARVGGFSATTTSLQGSLSVASNTETGVDWSVTGLSTNSGYQRIIYFDLATSSGGSNVYGNSASAAASANSVSNTCWKIPPSTGSSATTLYYNCYVRFDGQTNVDGKQVQFLLTSGTYTVPYTQGTISGMSKTETSITCQLTGLSSYPVARTISIDAIPTSGTTINYSDTISANTTNKTNIQITGLKKGTSYTVYAYVKFGTTYGPSSNNWYSLGWYQVTTDGVDIDIWTWTAPNTCKAITRTGTIATQAQMTSAKNALDKVSGYTTQDFSHRVWNDLVWKISEARVAMGISSQWNNNYGLTRDQTLMSENNSNDRILTAARYNALKNNLGENHSTGIADVSTNELIIAQTHFYQLTNKLNEWIG